MEDILKQLGEAGELMTLRGDESAARVSKPKRTPRPIIRFVDLILYQAIQDRASDIHFEPFENEFKIRYRVDGALYEMAPPPRHLALPVISRVKVMANLNIAERRLPQDGRIQKNIAGRSDRSARFDSADAIRRSVVLRVLDRSTVNLDLEALGLPDYIHDYILEVIHRPNGIFIVTGPTGSGKTTTLYSCLRKINTIDSKLLTAEEPVEYDLEGIMQVPVNEAIGLTFARVLRAFLRQDPDRIMVGEMRDLETAQIAIQASLTGHLVFTTLHTNDAPGAVTRLIDMGVEPFLISSTLEAVLGQRLLAQHLQELPHALSADRIACSPSSTSRRTTSATRILTTAEVATLQPHRLQRPQGHLRVAEDHRSDPRTDQRARAHRGPEAKGGRARHGHPAPGRLAQHFRRRHHHRRSAEIHLIE